MSAEAVEMTTARDMTAADDRRLAELVDELGELVQKDSRGASLGLGALAVEAARRGLAEVEARAAYLRARAEVNLGDLTTALELIDRARRTWVAAGDPLSACRTDLGRMHVLDDLGRHADAVSVGEGLVADLASLSVGAGASRELEQVAWMRAAALENIGVGRGFMGDHAHALEAYAGAERTYRDLGLDDELPRPMANRGVELIEVGRFPEAVVVLRDAASRFATHDDRISVAKCLAHEARAHLRLGDYVEAAAAIQRSHRHLDGQAITTEYARTQLVRAETLASLNLLEEALELYDAIVPQLRRARLRHDLTDARYGRALLLGRLGRRDEALGELRDVAASYTAMDAGVLVAVTRLAQSELVEPEEAAGLVDGAIGELRSMQRPVELATALLRRAQLTDDPELADASLDEAAATLEGHDAPSVRWRIRHEQGRRLVDAGRLVDARTAFADAADVIEALRSTVPEERHRLSFMADRSVVLEDSVALELEADDVGAAFETAERARARTLVERLHADAAPVDVTTSSEALDSIYTDLLVHGPSQELRHRARRLERTLAPDASGPPPAALPRTMPRAPAALGDPLTVVYQCIRDEVLAFVRSGVGLAAVRRLATVGEIHDLLAQLDAQWRRFEDPGMAARQRAHLLAVTTDILQQLHLRLLSPLALPSDAVDLLISPTGPLGNVPFAALHDGTDHVITGTTVTMTPSLTVADHARRRSRGSTERRLVVGVADAHAPLVGTEAREVADAAGSATLLLDDAATVERVRREASAHDVIHIACHGVHRPDSPAFSALRLGDRWLTSAEVAGFGLDGQTVVLSACSSGRQLAAGTPDELVGLPRAFLAAGAGAVVVNLWQVDDSSARRLMTRFHSKLKGHEPAVALREAQLELMHRTPHPYHWAPAVVFGGPPARLSATTAKEQR